MTPTTITDPDQADADGGETAASTADEDPFLRDLWYLAASGETVKTGRTTAVTVLGEPLLIGRDAADAVFAIRNICPHRGIPLHYGRFDGREITCGYHGWRFDTAGRCTAIPSLTPGQHYTLERIRCRAFACQEVQGNIWVHMPRTRTTPDPATLPSPPEVPDMGLAGPDARPKVAINVDVPCTADNAAYGLIDPTHAAFVHTSAWWKKGATTLRLKEKHFEPTPLGWRMRRHPLPSTHRVYRLLGDNVTSEITFLLPGVRIESIRGDRHAAVSLTVITPIDRETSRIHQCLYWTVGWLNPLRPIIRRLSQVFLNQDKVVAVRQAEGLAHTTRLILVDDADTQVKWFVRCKREYQRAQAEGRPFRNPVEARTLRWHS